MGASGHAYVVRGYHGAKYMSIWNPYNASYETVQYGSRMLLSDVESTWGKAFTISNRVEAFCL